MEHALMNLEELYHFLFETYQGIGVMVAAGIVISFIACVIMERKIRKRYSNRPKSPDDWSLFDDDDEEEETSNAQSSSKTG